MQRLTHERSNGIKTGYWSPEKKEDLVARLAEYENTGLAPDEIESLNEFEGSNTQKYLLELAKHQWIPVEERLPEKRDNYLCTVECAGYRHRIIGHYNDPGWTNDCGGRKVIAWMPLPEPYKGTDND